MIGFNKTQIPTQVMLISGVLHEAGYQAWLVGGAVRDGIIGEEPNDYDFCTNANAAQVVEVLIANNIEYNDEFSFLEYTIATVDNMDIDIVRFHGNSIEEDLLKRDLTINAIAYDIETDSFVDVCGGLEDLENRIIRIINKDAILESPKIILRAMRFSLQFGFRIDDESYAAMIRHLPELRNIKTSTVEKIIGKTLKCCKDSFMGKEEKKMEYTGKETDAPECAEKMEEKIPVISQEERDRMAQGVQGGKLCIVDYDPSWPKKANEVMKELAGIFSDAVLIKHVGSTSIVGMPAKPILDILVTLTDFGAIDSYQEKLESVGIKTFVSLGPGHRCFYREDPATGHHLIHVHVCESGSKAQDYLSNLSDYCNAVPEARESYALLKKALILRYGDRPGKYGPAKAQFVLDLTADAIAWKKQQDSK